MSPSRDDVRIRPAAVAGSFYPADPTTLRATVDGFLAQVTTTAPGDAPKAMIVPHAGYIYSGPVAASAYARLAPVRHAVRRVVLLGPSHFCPITSLATSSAAGFATPLGTVPVDRESVERLQALPRIEALDHAHAREHSLEVQLPFLQVTLDRFEIVPLLFGDTDEDSIAAALDAVWGDGETLVVVSTDLSHYRDYPTAREIDARTSGAILRLRPEAIGWDQACGRTGVCGLLAAATRHGLHPVLADLRSSGDTAGPRDRVVGYGAFLFQARPEPEATPAV